MKKKLFPLNTDSFIFNKKIILIIKYVYIIISGTKVLNKVRTYYQLISNQSDFFRMFINLQFQSLFSRALLYTLQLYQYASPLKKNILFYYYQKMFKTSTFLFYFVLNILPIFYSDSTKEMNKSIRKQHKLKKNTQNQDLNTKPLFCSYKTLCILLKSQKKSIKNFLFIFYTVNPGYLIHTKTLTQGI